METMLPLLFGSNSTHVFVFSIIIAIFLYIDLALIHKKNEKDSFTKSIYMSIFWIVLALAFNGYIWWGIGKKEALDFLTGYVIEKSLSVDNLFVFILIFKCFSIPPRLQHRTLFYGIFGAFLFRIIMIFIGIDLLKRFSWIIYVFGAFLIYAGIMAFLHNSKDEEPQSVKLVKKLEGKLPITHELHSDTFFIRTGKRLIATPLFLALITIELSDIVFALDSIPAILAITTDPFIVLTSNIFAILGLRSLYFALAPLLEIFQYLHYGIGIILVYVGIKFLIQPIFHIPTLFSLSFIMLTLTACILTSIWAKKR